MRPCDALSVEPPGSPTPEAAALSGWSSPRTVVGATISPRGDEAFVLLAGDNGTPCAPMYDVMCPHGEDGWVDMGGGGGYCGEDGYPFAYQADCGVVAGLAVRTPGRREVVVDVAEVRQSAPVRPDGWAFVACWLARADGVVLPRLVAVL